MSKNFKKGKAQAVLLKQNTTKNYNGYQKN
jgi:hypothetical protein